MKTTLKIAAVLTWFNIIVWGGMVAALILGVLATGMFPLLAGVVLLSSIPLSCFAGLKLHGSIRNPTVPLSHQTPAGIRFVGLMAMFFGIYFIFSGISLLANPKAALEYLQQAIADMPVKPLPRAVELEKYFVVGGASISIVLGILIAGNVILNMRLLRWYYLAHKSDIS
jgi:hypothetical protein